MHPSNYPTLEQLASDLEVARAELDACKGRVAQAESLIVDHPKFVELRREEGAVSIGPLSVSYGLTRKWDQALVAEIAKDINPAFLPFNVEYKEDRRAMKVLTAAMPDLEKRFEPALTETPRKPSVKLRPATNEAA